MSEVLAELKEKGGEMTDYGKAEEHDPDEEPDEEDD